MKDRGQAFTLDMLFALILVAAVLSVSGQAFELASEQAGSYSTRYSLERVANDAADVLVKTAGDPLNWEENLENLVTPGLATVEGGEPVRNTLDIQKFGWLRDLCRDKNWDPAKSGVQTVMNLFGDSENFEITIFNGNGENLWRIWPRWDVEESSGVENSPEVAVVRRLVAMRSGEVRGGIRMLVHVPGEWLDNVLRFRVYPGELDVFDWYIVLKPSEKSQPTTHIYVNRPVVGGKDYDFPPDTIFIPRYHGGDDPQVQNPLTDVENNGQPNNYLTIRVKGSKHQWVDAYVVALPKCSPSEFSLEALGISPGAIEVKLWR